MAGTGAGRDASGSGGGWAGREDQATPIAMPAPRATTPIKATTGRGIVRGATITAGKARVVRGVAGLMSLAARVGGVAGGDGVDGVAEVVSLSLVPGATSGVTSRRGVSGRVL